MESGESDEPNCCGVFIDLGPSRGAAYVSLDLLSGGYGGAMGGLNAVGSISGLGSGLIGAGIGAQSREQKRTGTAIRNSVAQASRLGMQHASVAARYQLGVMAGGV